MAIFASLHSTEAIIASLVLIINQIDMIYSKIEGWGWLMSDLQSSAIKLCNLKQIYPESSDLKVHNEETNLNLKEEKITSIQVKNYRVEVGKFKINYNVNFESGKVYVISGSSGKGKTTLINSMCGLREITSGHIVVNEKYKVSSLYNYREKISYLFQDSLLFDRSIEENISYPENNLNEKAKELIEYFDLEKLLKRSKQDSSLSTTLSGGEKKRIDFIRTICKDKDVYLFDEPTNDLDEQNINKVLSKFKELKKLNKIIIIISHDNRCIKIADELISL